MKTKFVPKPGYELDPLYKQTSITKKDCEDCSSYLACAIDGKEPVVMPSTATCKYIHDELAKMLKKRGR